jgi:hypothetical protein
MKTRHTPCLLAARTLVIGLAALVVASARAEPLETRDAIRIQKLRAKLIAGKKAKVYYTGKRFEPKAREFLRYVLSQEGQTEVVRDGKYLPLNADLVRAAMKSLE